MSLLFDAHARPVSPGNERFDLHAKLIVMSDLVDSTEHPARID